MVDLQERKKVFAVRDDAPYFSEALGFSLPSLLINPALNIGQNKIIATALDNAT